MNFVLKSLLSIIILGIEGLCDLLGTTFLSMLTLDIGQSGSFFATVFGDSNISSIGTVVKTVSMVILFVNTLWQLIKIMIAPNEAESPFMIMGGTLFAGMLVAYSGDIILHFEQMFNYIYDYILGTSVTFNFASYTDHLHSAFLGGLSDALPGNPLSSISIGNQLIVVLLLIRMLFSFISYIVECVERYVVLGVLYYMGPMALATAGAKSTRSIFSAYIRMLGSQLILMLCNVIFFKLFLSGLGSYDAVANRGGFNLGAGCVVWGIMLCGVLDVGMKMDAYLGTLGLNAVQTGRGLAASIMATGFAVGRIVSSAAGRSYSGGSTKASTTSKPDANAFTGRNRVNDSKQDGNKNSSMAQAAASKEGKVSDGKKATPNDIATAMNNAAAGKQGTSNVDGVVGGKGMYDATKSSVSEASRKNWDLDSFHIGENGTATMKTRDGDGTTVSFATEENLKAFGQDASTVGGRRMTMMDTNGQQIPLVMTYSGPSSDKYTLDNPAAEAHKERFANQPNCSVENSSSQPGVWTETKRDADGNITSAMQYSPASLYQADTSLNVGTEEIGGMKYNVADVTGMQNGTSRMSTPMPGTVPHSTTENGGTSKVVPSSRDGSATSGSAQPVQTAGESQVGTTGTAKTENAPILEGARGVQGSQQNVAAGNVTGSAVPSANQANQSSNYSNGSSGIEPASSQTVDESGMSAGVKNTIAAGSATSGSVSPAVVPTTEMGEASGIRTEQTLQNGVQSGEKPTRDLVPDNGASPIQQAVFAGNDAVWQPQANIMQPENVDSKFAVPEQQESSVVVDHNASTTPLEAQHEFSGTPIQMSAFDGASEKLSEQEVYSASTESQASYASSMDTMGEMPMEGYCHEPVEAHEAPSVTNQQSTSNDTIDENSAYMPNTGLTGVQAIHENYRQTDEAPTRTDGEVYSKAEGQGERGEVVVHQTPIANSNAVVGENSSVSYASQTMQFMGNAFPELKQEVAAGQVSNVNLHAGNDAFGKETNGDAGIISYQNMKNGATYALAPAGEYSIKPDFQKYVLPVIKADNNAPYVRVLIDPKQDLSQVFDRRINRGGQNGYDRKQSVNLNAIPRPNPLLKAAMTRKGNKKSKK